MFFHRPRRADPIELTDQFTTEETARISSLHRRFHTYPICFKLEINYRRLEFARWLVDHGYLNEWSDTQPDPVGRAPDLQGAGHHERCA